MRGPAEIDPWDQYAAIAHADGHGRTVSLPPAYGPEAVEPFATLSPCGSLAAAMEPLLREWIRLGLAHGVLPGRAEASLWADALRHQMAMRRGLPAEPLWHGPRGRERGWILDLSAFVEPDLTVAAGALGRAAAAALTALEIAGPPDPLRPVFVIPANLAGALMAALVPYSWPEGRASAAALIGVVLGAAAEASAALAVRLGPCPGWTERRATVLRRLEAAIESLPAGAEPGLATAAQAALERGLAAARRSGLRNLGLVALRPAGPVERLLGADSSAEAPLPSIIRFVDGPDGRPRRQLIEPARRAIAALGLDPMSEAAAIAHIVGHGTLCGAPQAALDRLAALGLTPAQLAPHLPSAVSLAHALALAAPGLAVPETDTALAALERYAIGAGTADEAPFLPARARAALAEGADEQARAAMSATLAPYQRLGLEAATPVQRRRTRVHALAATG